jgi:hypothetical protein
MPANGNDKILSATRSQVAELEAQLSTYRGDLHVGRESSRVACQSQGSCALLKPLQDAVGKREGKVVLRRQLDSMNNDSPASEEPM